MTGRVAALVLVLATASAAAQEGASPELKAELVKTGLYVVAGRGGNSVVRMSAGGLVVVDGQPPGDYKALDETVDRLFRKPVQVLINTNCDARHTGTNAEFLKTGAAVLAQNNVGTRLLTGKAIPPPNRTFDRDMSFHLGGIEVQLLHFGNARTDGDSVVYFPDLRVVAVGDLYSSGDPVPDSAAGGTITGWSAALDEILKLDFDLAVPGAGAVVSRKDLEDYRNRLRSLTARPVPRKL